MNFMRFHYFREWYQKTVDLTGGKEDPWPNLDSNKVTESVVALIATFGGRRYRESVNFLLLTFWLLTVPSHLYFNLASKSVFCTLRKW